MLSFSQPWIWYIAAAVFVFDGLILSHLARRSVSKRNDASLLASDPDATPGRARDGNLSPLTWIARGQFALALAALAGALYLHFG